MLNFEKYEGHFFEKEKRAINKKSAMCTCKIAPGEMARVPLLSEEREGSLNQEARGRYDDLFLELPN